MHRRNDPEHQLQKSIIDYVNKVLPALRPYMFAIPNGGQRNILVAIKLKSEGTMSGVWDIFICIPINLWHGLFIECKVGKNNLTESQKEFRNNLRPVGYAFSDLCKSVDDFESILINYFELKKLTNREIISRIECEKFIQKNHKEFINS
jgi:hypothetical protein